MNLNRLAYFVAVVDAGSFTRAAAHLGVTKAVVSHQVAQLEQDLQVSLLVRTTRRVHPTEAGRLFHARCVMILHEAENAFDEIAQGAAAPIGLLRIAASNDYGSAVVVPVITAFSARYPACRVELTLGDAMIDLAEGRIDVAIRVGWLEDSDLQARKIGMFRQCLVGGQAFADQVMAARHPDDLLSLPFIANMALREPLVWEFSHETLDQHSIRMNANIAINTTPAVLAAVHAGGGISVLPDFLVADDLKHKRLYAALPEWHLPAGGIYTVYPAARFRPPKVTAFVEMLVAAEREKSLRSLRAEMPG